MASAKWQLSSASVATVSSGGVGKRLTNLVGWRNGMQPLSGHGARMILDLILQVSSKGDKDILSRCNIGPFLVCAARDMTSLSKIRPGYGETRPCQLETHLRQV